MMDIHELPDEIAAESPVRLHPVMRKRMFEKGQELFNDGKFFEAHEEWEHLWKFEIGRDKSFVQGMIQVAGHFVHLERGRWEAASRMAYKAAEKLVIPPADPYLRSLDTLPFTAALEYNSMQAAPLKTENPPEGLGRFLVPKLF